MRLRSVEIEKVGEERLALAGRGAAVVVVAVAGIPRACGFAVASVVVVAVGAGPVVFGASEGGGDGLVGAFDEFVELAAVEPDPAALIAPVDFDSLAFRDGQRHLALGAKHGVSPSGRRWRAPLPMVTA